MCSLASGVESLLSMSNGGRNSVHRLYGLAGPQMASQTVGRTQASDIFRYSDIQIFRYSDIFRYIQRQKAEKRKKLVYWICSWPRRYLWLTTKVQIALPFRALALGAGGRGSIPSGGRAFPHHWQTYSLASGVESNPGAWAVEGISVHRLYRTPPQPSKTLTPSNGGQKEGRTHDFLLLDTTTDILLI